MRQELSDKYSNLCAALRREKKLAVAFSAGVDSTLLLKAAVNTLGNENVLAVTALSASFPEREADEADVFTRGIGVSRITVEVDQLSIPGFRENPANRCYLCKKVLFTRMMEAAREQGFEVMAEGSNVDDLSDYRPGLKAIEELGVRSPLREAGLTKAEIRELSSETFLCLPGHQICLRGDHLRRETQESGTGRKAPAGPGI